MRSPVTKFLVLAIALGALRAWAADDAVSELVRKAESISPSLRFQLHSTQKSLDGKPVDCQGTLVERVREGAGCRYRVLTSQNCAVSAESADIRFGAPFTETVSGNFESTSNGRLGILSFTGLCLNVEPALISTENSASQGLLCFTKTEVPTKYSVRREGTRWIEVPEKTEVATQVGTLQEDSSLNTQWHPWEAGQRARPSAGAGVFCDSRGRVRLSAVRIPNDSSAQALLSTPSDMQWVLGNLRDPTGELKNTLHAVPRGPAVLGAHEFAGSGRAIAR